jgi:peptidoglycan hydrolase CwlO-like protein
MVTSMGNTVGMEEAARRLNVSVATIRRKLKNGELRGYQKPIPQGFTWEVELPNDLEFNPDSYPSSNLTSGSHVTQEGEVAALRELVKTLQGQVGSLQQQVDRYEHQLEVKDTQISELHVLLQMAQKTLPAPQEHRRWWWPFT